MFQCSGGAIVLWGKLTLIAEANANVSINNLYMLNYANFVFDFFYEG